MSESLSILGHDKNMHTDTIVEFIILFAKQYIYSCKLNMTIPNLPGFFAKLKYRFQIEEYIARKNFLYNEFSMRWYPYKLLLN